MGCEELEARDTLEKEEGSPVKSWKHANDRPTGKHIRVLLGGRDLFINAFGRMCRNSLGLLLVNKPRIQGLTGRSS